MHPKDKQAYEANRKQMNQLDKAKTLGCVWKGGIVWGLSLLAALFLDFISQQVFEIPLAVGEQGFIAELSDLLIISGGYGIPIVVTFAVFLYKINRWMAKLLNQF